jgi:leucyl aminopeptidase
MLTSITASYKGTACPIHLIETAQYEQWLKVQPSEIKTWLEKNYFRATPGESVLMMDEHAEVKQVFVGVQSAHDLSGVGALALKLPAGYYAIEATAFAALDLQLAVIFWGLGAYQFTKYKPAMRAPAILLVPKCCDYSLIENTVESIYWVRDLINTPFEDMAPVHLSEAAFELAEQYHAKASEWVDEELLDENCPAIFTVGRGSDHAPRLIDLTWGSEDLPKVTLVGKGVCFDTGGFNLKSGVGMSLMKKDMGGAANVLGLARMIMQAKLPVRLRVLIPAVDNAVSGDAYRPGDVITMRNGKTVEVTNTDAEGRLVLADALARASEESPELLIDLATLTGAAKVALGTEMPALFCEDLHLVHELFNLAERERDPFWPMPLPTAYFRHLKSLIADFTNSAKQPFGGAILAALFLREFVEKNTTWVHVDLMGWNVDEQPGRPVGGEAQIIRALFMYLRQRYSSRH